MQDLVSELVVLLEEKNLKLATAESCTGGLPAATLTQKPGVSRVFERGFVTYSNEAKIEMLNVSAALIAGKGAVSAEVASAMARGALINSRADVAVSITGIAGPDGGTPDKPVGLVHFGCAMKNGYTSRIERRFSGTRQEIQIEAVITALQGLIAAVKAQP